MKTARVYVLSGVYVYWNQFCDIFNFMVLLFVSPDIFGAKQIVNQV